jgi:hypothetical protein
LLLADADGMCAREINGGGMLLPAPGGNGTTPYPDADVGAPGRLPYALPATGPPAMQQKGKKWRKKKKKT